MVGEAIEQLLVILSTWTPGECLVLELSAHSPSDLKDWFMELIFASDETDHSRINDPLPKWHDPGHGWANGKRFKFPPEAAMWRLFDEITPTLSKACPHVSVGTSLIIRRQLRRHLNAWALRQILHRLYQLKDSKYEPWGFSNNQGAETKKTEGIVANRFASHSRTSVELSLAFMVDAQYFFSSCKSGWMWERLRSLALTSPVLRDPEMDPKMIAKIDGLLYQAGLTAVRMPALQTMVLWNGGCDNACAFIYQAAGRGPRITWRSSWPFVISSPVEKLPVEVVYPRSLWQIRREFNAFRESLPVLPDGS
ncbi:hypothetical protein GE09DRAFT_1062106 [Coniochaeta sp. 2T2.1]|nr:hypothetical protein GE09DRAFT_1062106 [Coniochaeta sp. 2T2.1]